MTFIGLAQTMFQMSVLQHDIKHEKLQGIQQGAFL